MLSKLANEIFGFFCFQSQKIGSKVISKVYTNNKTKSTPIGVLFVLEKLLRSDLKNEMQ